MPASAAAASARERRLSSGSSAGRRRPRRTVSVSVSINKGGDTAASGHVSAPPLVTTPEPGLQSILVQPASSDPATSHHADHEQQAPSNNNTAASYLKPLLKFLPKHIDPSTIARLLKNVHPTAFGSYRTKEAWRREHPEVLSTAHFLNKRDEERERAARLSSGNSNTVDIETSEAVLRGAAGAEDDFCLAHSPPSATFSSSSSSDDDDDDEDDAKELDEYFKDSSDDDDNNNDEQVLSDTDSISSLDSVSSFAAQSGRQRRHRQRQRQRGVKNVVSRAGHDREEQGASKQCIQQQEGHASDGHGGGGGGGGGGDGQVVLSPLPLAIVLSRPDDEQAILEERGHVLGNETTAINNSGVPFGDDGLSRHAQTSGSTAVVEEDAVSPACGLASTASTSFYHSTPSNTSDGQDTSTSGSSSIPQPSSSGNSISTSPNRSPASSPSFPPSPPQPTSSTSPLPSPSTSYSPPLAPPSPSSSSSLSVHSSSSRAGPSSTQPTSATAAPAAYPTIQLLKSVRRQRSSSSLASECTCRSNASAASATSSIASRTSSVRFGPVPEEALARRRSREQSTDSSNISNSSAEKGGRGGGKSSSMSKSAVMGVRGRKNLLRGKTEDGISVDEILRGSSASPANGSARLALPEQRSNSGTNANLGYRRPILSESETERPDQDEDDDDDYAIGDSDDDSASADGKSERRFDAIAFFGEEDPSASTTLNARTCSSSSSSSASAYFRVDPQQYARGSTGHASSLAGGGVYRSSSSASSSASSSSAAIIKKRTASDATILVGRNGELVERRPLGVTLEELTLPMKRVKETRGRSRQTNDLSASFTSKAALASGLPSSPPTSPRSPSLATLPPLSDQSPSRSYLQRSIGISPSSSSSAPLTTTMSGENGSPQNDKTPTATPRFEKLDLFLTTIHSPPSTSSRKSSNTSASSTAMSPSNSSLSPTSPTQSQGSHSHTTTHGSSNDITPMATPRAGSPIAGLKMTAAAVHAHSEAVSKGFTLDERFMVARSASPAASTSSSFLGGIAARSDINASSVPPAVDSPFVESALPSLSNSADSSPEPEEQDGPLHAALNTGGDHADDDDGFSDASDDEDAEHAAAGAAAGHDDVVVIAQSDDDDDDGRNSPAELDVKTPTLGSCLGLPELRKIGNNSARTPQRKRKPVVAGARKARPAAGTALVKKAKKT